MGGRSRTEAAAAAAAARWAEWECMSPHLPRIYLVTILLSHGTADQRSKAASAQARTASALRPPG